MDQIKHLLIGVICAIFLMSIVSAETYRIEDNIDLKISCININCTNPTTITIDYPNSSIAIDNQSMTLTNGYLNYSFISSVTGEYKYFLFSYSSDGTEAYYSSSFNINGYGSDISTSQAIMYGILVLISLLVFLITCIGAYAMPFTNNRNDEGKIVSINDLKYLKIVLIIFAYLEFLFVISIVKNIAMGFLLNDGIYNLLNIVYTAMLIGLIPMFPLLIFFTIVIWLSDQKTLKNLERGIE